MTNKKQIKSEAAIAIKFLHKFHVNNDKEAIEAGEMLYQWKKLIREGDKEIQGIYNYLKLQIDQYEQTVQHPEVTGAELLKYLMEEHNHKQIDLTDVAPRSVISEILHGKRDLNKNHIARLACKYNVSPALYPKEITEQNSLSSP